MKTIFLSVVLVSVPFTASSQLDGQAQTTRWAPTSTNSSDDSGVFEPSASGAVEGIYIELPPARIGPNRLVYSAAFAGKPCAIEVAKDADAQPSQWQVTEQSCTR